MIRFRQPRTRFTTQAHIDELRKWVHSLKSALHLNPGNVTSGMRDRIAHAIEAVEAIDPQAVEGIRATGAMPIEEVTYGIIPQVIPLWISYSLYRFEANVRSASVIGMVGAGGIGMLLWDAIRSFDYAKTAAIILVIVVVVSVLDFASSRVRRLYI